MRKFLLRASMVIGILIIALAAAGVALAVFGPLRPGSSLFVVQDFAEQQRRHIYRGAASRANYLLDLVERRIDDLKFRTGSQYELIAMDYLDQAIDQATLAISIVPQDQSEALRTRLVSLARQADQALSQLKRVPIENQSAFTALEAKVKTIQHMMETVTTANSELALVEAISAVSHTDPAGGISRTYSSSGLVPFPPGSPGAVHAFYPLVGQHATLACESCHAAGRYLGTPNKCINCHILKKPSGHYPGECGLCHTPLSWTDIHFDHTVVASTSCSACHEKDKPANHYRGACSACHITENWTTINFDHAVAGAVDCVSCHEKDAPAKHYPGQCSNCHNTSNWTEVVFDHTGFTDCISCHAEAAPANHYAGQCGRCHSTTTWKNAVFDHTGFTDCISCHANAAPANHYPGQCSRCHSTSGGWSNYHFDHSGFTDCIGCHSGVAPAGHYPGQCSNCHNTSNWSNWVFNHAGFTDCISCHSKDRPADHDSGQCSECHNTSGWGDGGGDGGGGLAINTPESFPAVDCAACHTNVAYSGGEGIKQ